MNKFKNCILLFLAFFKIGLITFGGGYAMVAIIENELVEKKRWIEKNEFLDVIAIAESTPGPIAINSATFIGYKRGGFWGSFFSTLGVVLPSFIIIFAVSFVFERFLSLKYVGYAFHGIQACVAYLIFSAGIKMFKGLKRTAFNVTLFLTALIAMVTLSVLSVSFSSVYYILLGGAVGLIAYLIAYGKERKQKAGLNTENAAVKANPDEENETASVADVPDESKNENPGEDKKL